MALNKDTLTELMISKLEPTYEDPSGSVPFSSIEPSLREFVGKLAEALIEHITTSGVVTVAVATTGTAAAQTGTGTGTIS